MMGISFLLDIHYDIDYTISLPLILIPTGLYIAFVPKRIKEKSAVIKFIPEPEKNGSDLGEWAKTIVFGVLVALIIVFLVYHFIAHILGLILLGVVLFTSTFISEFFKRRK